MKDGEREGGQRENERQTEIKRMMDIQRKKNDRWREKKRMMDTQRIETD
jgi:hypothetical protein